MTTAIVVQSVNMKIAVVLAGLFSFCAAGALFRDIPVDNSHYVEGESRYIWMQDDEGELHLIDLQAPVEETATARNGANNAYWLFTRQNPTNRQILVRNDNNSVRNSNYRANRGTAVIVHGWNGSGSSSLNTAITSAFLAAMDVNVIVVDWSRLAGNLIYNSAASGTPSVGNYLADFLTWLFNNHGGNWNQLHLVGFSLGAHAVGVAGRRIGGRAARVTGLDPAGPNWGGNGPMSSHRLTNNAGRYVEAIHTDGRALGVMDRSADADFYPNGGRHVQPGCRYIATTSCSHSRSHELFASSVRTHNRFVGRRCNDLRQAERNECTGAQLHMGNGVINKSGSGIYGLRTGSSWPF